VSDFWTLKAFLCPLIFVHHDDVPLSAGLKRGSSPNSQKVLIHPSLFPRREKEKERKKEREEKI
jgi:hypothetical protein